MLFIVQSVSRYVVMKFPNFGNFKRVIWGKMIAGMKKSTYKTMRYLKEYLENCLDELYEEKSASEFIYGEKTAYVECLELLQQTTDAKSIGLDYAIEKRYPL